MKRNIINGLILISALALGSCSTSKLASNQLKDDDVYYSQAKAGDAPVYVPDQQTQRVNNQDRYNGYSDDDYYYYNSYASRINRFGYLSPFSYYDDLYYGYSPYYGNYGYNSYYGSAFGLGLGLGSYYGYSPYGYGGYYGYSPYGYGYGYNYFGTGYGYGGGGYWGVYSAYNNNTPRPYRGSGAPGNALVNRNSNPVGYNGNYPVNGNYPGRPTINNTGGRQGTYSTNGNSTYNSNGNNSGGRPVRNDAPRQAPVYQPQSVERSSPPPSNSGGNTSSGSSGSSSSGGGGGGRPVRP